MWPFCNVAKLLKMDDANVQQLVYQNWFRALQFQAFGFPSSFTKGCGPLFRRSYFVDVPHVRQLCNWDCGLACVLMVLRTLGIDNCDLQYLEKLCNTTSIWTIDLAYLLHKFSVTFSFLTVTIGANPKFSVESFYKEQLPSDVGRVERLFEKAREHGIDIEPGRVCDWRKDIRCITGKEISILILSGQYIAIALVDKHKLSHQSIGVFPAPDWFSSSPSYTGHFVVICGYDGVANEFEIRDPASSSKCERVSFNCLDEARKSFGTDEDILLVSLANRAKLENLPL